MFLLINFNSKTFKFISVFILSIVVLTGCQSASKDSVAKVNGDLISKAEFDESFNMAKKLYEDQMGPDVMAQKGEDGRTIEAIVKEGLLEELIREKLIFKEAEKNKISVSDEEVNKLIKEITDNEEGKKQYEKHLKENNIEEKEFKDRIKKDMIMRKYLEDYTEKTKVTDEEATKFFEENKETFEMVGASHILLEKEEEAKKVLEEIEKGEDFKALAKEKSTDEGSAKEGGKLGHFTREKMLPEFSEVAFSLEVGEVSEVVKSEFGYHIIKVEDKLDKYDKLTDEAKEEVIQGIKNNKLQEHIGKMRDEAKVKIYMKEDEKPSKKIDGGKKDNKKEENKKTD